jgi:hypothetical protein
MKTDNVELNKTESSGNVVKSSLAVWEEALLVEFLYAIGHLNHVEQHLLESDSYIGAPLFGDIVDMFREQRKLVGQVMFLLEKLEAVKSGSQDLRSSWESIWCALKHATTALIHIDECVEKILKKFKSESGMDYIECVKTLLRVRENILKNIIEMIKRGKSISSILSESSVRCREDLCLEEVVKQ